ncbi:MAG: FecR domain-containing protein, partial [Gammaproteobacteria bacterium]|nr:FecR domain-containing protein [Gammaproteobacteria bacterium]
LIRPNSRFQIAEYRYSGPTPQEQGQRSSTRSAADRTVEEDTGGNAVFRLLKGGFRAITGLIGRDNKENFKVRTPVATIGIRGTNFEARLCAGDCFDIDPMPRDGLYAGVFEGGISLENSAGTFNRDAGQFGFVAGFSQKPQGLKRRPKALSQDPMPDPEACD